MQEAKNILRIFEESKRAVEKDDNIKLKELSNQTIHTASTSQDPDNVAVAVIIYSISKIIERGAFKNFPDFEKKILFMMKKIIGDLNKNDEKSFRKNLEEFRKLIEKFSGKLREYIQDVFRKASINKASKIYEHGVSMERTASLLGITMFELASYAGQKGIDSKEEKTLSVKERIKLAVGMFG